MKIYTSGLKSALLGHRGTDMKMVVALGGNAVLQRSDRPDAGVQTVHVRAAGVQAVVVDHDYVAAMPAITVGVDPLIVRTDVWAGMTGFGTPDAAALGQVSLAEARRKVFPAGSMTPQNPRVADGSPRPPADPPRSDHRPTRVAPLAGTTISARRAAASRDRPATNART